MKMSYYVHITDYWSPDNFDSSGLEKMVFGPYEYEKNALLVYDVLLAKAQKQNDSQNYDFNHFRIVTLISPENSITYDEKFIFLSEDSE